MKYSFFIDQKAIVEAGFADKTDFLDWILLDYIRSWEGAKYSIKRGSKTWICLSHIKNGIPLAGISDPSAFSRRLTKLADIGLIEKWRDSVENKLYVETTILYHRITHSDDQEPVVLNQEPVVLNQEPVDLNQEPVVLNQEPVVLNQRIHKSVYINQDSEISIQKKAQSASDKKAKQSSDIKILHDFGIVGQLAEDFIKHRKRKRAEITRTALEGYLREASKADISLRQAVTFAIERGWTGFNADWYSNSGRAGRLMTKAQESQAVWELSKQNFLSAGGANTFEGEVVYG